jgi:Lon protease-like protein
MNTFLQLPLFPLGTTLFPDGNLSLQIFEVRYLTMIKNAMNFRNRLALLPC